MIHNRHTHTHTSISAGGPLEIAWRSKSELVCARSYRNSIGVNTAKAHSWVLTLIRREQLVHRDHHAHNYSECVGHTRHLSFVLIIGAQFVCICPSLVLVFPNLGATHIQKSGWAFKPDKPFVGDQLSEDH